MPSSIMCSVRRAVSAALVAALMALSATSADAAPEDRRRLDEFKRMLLRDDVAELEFYRDANELLRADPDRRPRVVLMGDSITFHWTADRLPAMPELKLVNRGVRGQVTTQMLLRFEDDVVALAPRTVVILAGTNDLRVFEGEQQAARASVVARARRNITAMADIAAARQISVVLSTVPPFANDPKLQRDLATLRELNDWIRAFAKERGYRLNDLYAALAGDDGYLAADRSADGLHPNDDAYRLMSPGLAAALR